jgi:hypothetical protein
MPYPYEYDCLSILQRSEPRGVRYTRHHHRIDHGTMYNDYLIAEFFTVLYRSQQYSLRGAVNLALVEGK